METTVNQTPTLGLYGKMAKIMGEMQHIPKNGTNSFFGYKFASEADISDAVRNKLSAHNIALFSSMTKWSQSQFTTAKGKTSNKTICEFEFTLVCADTGTSRTSTWCAEADDEQDKGFNKAATAAMKYWLLKTFMIPTGDDPDADLNKDQGKGKDAKWPTAQLIKGIVDGAINKLGITVEDVKRYAEIDNLDDLEAWAKYDSRNTAAKAIKEAYDKHIAEIAASKPATPKAPQPYIETELHKAVLNTYYDGNEHHMKNSIAKMLEENVLTHDMTLEHAVKVIEARKAAKMSAEETKKKLNSGEGERRMGNAPTPAETDKIIFDDNPHSEAEARAAVLARMEGEEVQLYKITRLKDVQGRGKQAGDKWLANAQLFEVDGSEQRVDITLFPEDVTAIKKAGHVFPATDGPVSIPVIIHIENFQIRINREKQPKKAANPFSKPTPTVDPAYEAIPSANTPAQPTMPGMPRVAEPMG